MKTTAFPPRFRSLSTIAILALLGLPLHAGTVTWDNSNGTNAWSAAAAGASKIGDGTLTLGATTGSFTGGFIVDAGTLRLATANAINTGNTITVNAGAILEAANISTDGSITWNQGATLAGSGTGATFTGTISIDALAWVLGGMGMLACRRRFSPRKGQTQSA